MDTVRKWHFSFEEYYDVYVWDATPGRPYSMLQRKLEEVSKTRSCDEITRRAFHYSLP